MKRFILLIALFISAITMHAQLAQHGLVLNGGIGRVDTETNYLSTNMWGEINYKAAISAGYRLRFIKPAPQSFHFDIDVNAGMKFSNFFLYKKFNHRP